MIVTSLIFLVAGFILLIQGANYLVKGGASLAKYFGLSTLVIGLTVIAFGTTTPELFVNLLSASKGTPALAIGNILGSNLVNLLLILGIGAVLMPIKVEKSTVWRQIPFAILGVLLLVLLGSDLLIENRLPSSLTRTDGVVFLVFFIIFLVYVYGLRRPKERYRQDKKQIEKYSLDKTLFWIFIGIIGLGLGGKFVVDSSVSIAKILGVSEHLIGMTIVAIGTSLPELATVVVSARKKEINFVIGNVIGANILNVFFILGLTSFIFPIPFTYRAFQDSFFLLAATMLLFLSLFIGDKNKITRRSGVIFIIIYIAYILYSIFRG